MEEEKSNRMEEEQPNQVEEEKSNAMEEEQSHQMEIENENEPMATQINAIVLAMVQFVLVIMGMVERVRQLN